MFDDWHRRLLCDEMAEGWRREKKGEGDGEINVRPQSTRSWRGEWLLD